MDRNLVILVKGIKYGDNGGHGVYNVQVTGPVEPVKLVSLRCSPPSDFPPTTAE